MAPKIEVVDHPNYRTINVSGVICSHQPMSFEIILFSEELKLNEALSDSNPSRERIISKRILESRLFMDPYMAKKLQNALNSHILQYEKKFGKIPSPEEIRDKTARDDLK